MNTITYTEEQVFARIEDLKKRWKERYGEYSPAIDNFLKELKDTFRTPQGFRRALEREGLIGTDFSSNTKESGK